jgi:hypothetical protein
MKIPRDQADKLGKYFINADPFLWDVLKSKNKKNRLRELKDFGYLQAYPDNSNANYSKINQDLLVELGIEGITEQIVIPAVRLAFTPETIEFFRRSWDQGQTPDIKYLKRYGLYHSHILKEEQYEGWRDRHLVGHKDSAHIFVQIDRQHEFIERWTVFAGLWFEEIEPLIEP